MLVPTSITYGWPSTIGLTLGVMIGNFMSPFGLSDMAVGDISNLIASAIGQQLRKAVKSPKEVLATTMLQNITITTFVRTYLWLISATSIQELLFYLLGMFVGFFVAINVLGFLLAMQLLRMSSKE